MCRCRKLALQPLQAGQARDMAVDEADKGPGMFQVSIGDAAPQVSCGHLGEERLSILS